MSPITPQLHPARISVPLIAAALVILLVLAGALALGFHTPAAPSAPYEKTLDIHAG